MNERVERRLVPIPGAELEILEHGSGEPVLFLQTALTADELVPLATHPALGRYHSILTHRRGYAGSSPAGAEGSIQRDAHDCVQLLAALGLERAHVVGLSFSGAIAMQLAADTTELVHTLTLIEPPPVHVPSHREFREANDRLLRARHQAGLDAALDEFLTIVIGPDWRDVTEHELPGSTGQMRRDVATFFDVDLPALLEWQFDADDAAEIRCPVLHVGGTDSGPWFAEVRELLLEWFPGAQDVRISGADHSLAITHRGEIARAVATFLQRHSMV